jgi:prepilin-type N-terminal cleavage/methylation domain-containing protein
MIFLKHKKNQNGFTLIELIVAIGVFSIVMVIATGSLLSVITANRKAQSFKSVLNNLSFAVESMSRSMRVGSVYHCGDVSTYSTERNCGSGDSFMAFEASNGDVGDPNDQIIYRLNGGRIQRSTNSGGDYSWVTAIDVVIDDLKFVVRGTGSNPSQPSVTISITGHMEIDQRTRTDFNLETYVSQRLLKR